MTTQPRLKKRATERADEKEAKLLAAIANRDRDAFDSLYRIYYPRLSDFLARMLAAGDFVDEVINDTMYVIWTKADTFAGRSRVSTWIFGIAYKKAIKRLEREGRARLERLPDDWAEHWPGEWQGEGHSNSAYAAYSEGSGDARSADKIVSEQQIKQTITQALDKLSPAHRSVVELTYEYGYSYAEIAEIVGCPENTVKTRMFHARGRLRKILETLAKWERS